MEGNYQKEFGIKEAFSQIKRGVSQKKRGTLEMNDKPQVVGLSHSSDDIPQKTESSEGLRLFSICSLKQLAN